MSGREEDKEWEEGKYKRWKERKRTQKNKTEQKYDK